MPVPHNWVAAEKLDEALRERGPQPGDWVRLAGGAHALVQGAAGWYAEWGVWTVEIALRETVDVVPTQERHGTRTWQEVEWGSIGPRYTPG